jgi:hypothetical protein
MFVLAFSIFITFSQNSKTILEQLKTTSLQTESLLHIRAKWIKRNFSIHIRKCLDSYSSEKSDSQILSWTEIHILKTTKLIVSLAETKYIKFIFLIRTTIHNRPWCMVITVAMFEYIWTQMAHSENMNNQMMAIGNCKLLIYSQLKIWMSLTFTLTLVFFIVAN